jgi:hypothetical protein
MTELDTILNGEVAAEDVQPQPEIIEEVAAPEVSEPAVAEQPEPEKEAPMVPLAALQEVRRELQDMKSRLPQVEAPKAPDVFDDPQGYQGFVQQQITDSAFKQSLRQSQFLAEREFGADVVKEAYDYFEANPAQSQELKDHPSPFHAAVEVYQRQKVAQEIGNDPQGYANKIEAEVRAKVEAEMATKQARDNAGKFAPSMANVTGTGGGPKTTWAGPTSLDNVFS